MQDVHGSESDGEVIEVSEGIFEAVKAANLRWPHPLDEQGPAGQEHGDELGESQLLAAPCGAASSSGSAHWPQQPEPQVAELGGSPAHGHYAEEVGAASHSGETPKSAWL